MKLSYKDIRGKHTLIVGEVGTGKTKLTRALLKEAAQIEPEIKVLDFAPHLQIHGGREVGGFLLDRNVPGVIHFKSLNIKTPRLSAKSPEELMSLADSNRVITEKMLSVFIESPSRVLFINDVSIHLQRGSLRDLMRAVEKTETSVSNGYLGNLLSPDYGTGLSDRERSMMNKLGERMDKVIYLKEED